MPTATITTISSREFNQAVSRAKKAAFDGPVFITNRGEPTHVLVSIETYRQNFGKKQNILDLLAMPEAAEIEFEIPPRLVEEPRPIDFD
jgi:prevent-host-death family protein